MHQAFKTAYDIQKSGGIQIYRPDDYKAALFSLVAVSVIFSALLLTIDKSRGLKSLIVLPVIGVLFSGYFLLDFWDRCATDRALRAGRLNVIEGCVRNFDTDTGASHSSKNSSPDETWSVGNDFFSYKQWTDRPGYHRREASGGVVHRGEYLRVGFLVTPIFHRKEIMKIEVGSEHCS